MIRMKNYVEDMDGFRIDKELLDIIDTRLAQ